MKRYLSKCLARDVLNQLYKLYVRPHLGYGDILYHRNDLDFRLDFTIVHLLSSGKGKMFLCAGCHAFTPHVNAWKNLIGIVVQIQARG